MTRGTRTIALLLVGLLVSACQPTPRIEGWRVLRANETRALAEARLTESPELPPPITEMQIDVNRDGKSDRVVLMVNDAGDRFAPYVFDGAGRPPVALSAGEPSRLMHRFGLSVLGWGHLYAMCQDKSAELGDCDDAKERRGHVTVLLNVDGRGELFPWNGERYERRTMRRDTYNLVHARPADEHPLAKQPWYVRQRQMPAHDSLPVFQPEG